MSSGLCFNGAMMVGVLQGGYKVAVLLSIVAFIASCRLLLYSAVAPAAWLHFAGEPPFTLTQRPQHPSLHCILCRPHRSPMTVKINLQTLQTSIAIYCS